MRRWVSSPSYEAVVRIVVTARTDAGLSQRELAKRLGKPPSYVAKIELRERRLDVVEFIALLRALGVSETEAFQELSQALSEKPDI